MEFDKLINKVKSGKVSSIAPEDVDAPVRQLERLKSDYTSNEKLGLLGTTLAKEGTLPLIQQGIPRGSSAIGTIETAEEIKRKLGQGMFKDSPLFAHPVKARAKELAELQIADAIVTGKQIGRAHV